MSQYMEQLNPMTCFQGQKATLTTRKFHLLPALPSLIKEHKELKVLMRNQNLKAMPVRERSQSLPSPCHRR